MSLDRKDVRAYLDHDAHEALARICTHRGVTVADFVESVLLREIKVIGHDAIELGEELRGLGMFRRAPEDAGKLRSGRR